MAEELHLPVVGLTDGSGRFKKTFNRYMFPMRASAEEESLAIAKHLQTLGISRAAIVDIDLPIGKAIHGAMLAGLKKYGIAVPAELTLAPDGSNAPNQPGYDGRDYSLEATLETAGDAAPHLTAQAERAPPDLQHSSRFRAGRRSRHLR